MKNKRRIARKNDGSLYFSKIKLFSYKTSQLHKPHLHIQICFLIRKHHIAMLRAYIKYAGEKYQKKNYPITFSIALFWRCKKYVLYSCCAENEYIQGTWYSASVVKLISAHELHLSSLYGE